MDLAIRDDRPIPERRGERRGRPPTYPWHTIVVGQSFKFPDKVGDGGHSQATMASARHHPKKFECHKTPEGWICWRVA